MNFDIVEILKVGLSGLVFLLAFMAYRLLALEQKKKMSDPNILRNVRLFSWQCIFLVLVMAGINIFERVTPLPPHVEISKCRESMLRLESLSALEGQSAEDLRLLIKNHVATCNGILKRLDED
jgi:hypothetical protein